MSVDTPIQVRELLSGTTFLNSTELEQLRESICNTQSRELRQEVDEVWLGMQAVENSQENLQRMGIASHLLGELRRADNCLSQVIDNALATFQRAMVLTSLDDHERAADMFEKASEQGFDTVACKLRQAGSLRSLQRLDEAEQLLRSVASKAASRAEYSFQMGCILADRGDTFGAIEYFERAVDMDPHHSRALFWLAGENSVRGNDEEAIRLYEQSLSRPPYYLGSLLNLGLMYEDRENYSAAHYCFQRILEFSPNHPRALLYLKDIEATHDMYYDEDSMRDEARMQALLSRPVTDFELSVRSRNCLQGMNIYTLGDLTEVNEQELLAGKNFGETSLQEIRQVLDAHGLQIGQHIHRVHSREAELERQNLSPQEQALFSRPVSDLNLSVRARKCMMRLNINTLAQLTQRTADELLSSRNFGVTSLNEIRAKLTEFAIKLRND